MTNAKRRSAIALAVAFLPWLLTVFAEDLTVAPGETVALNSSTNYVNITVEGTLNVARVGSGAAPKVSASNIAVNGGFIEVSGTRSALGHTDDQWTVRPLCTLSAANGAYGKLSISGNSSNTTLAQMQGYGLCAASLVIAEEPEGFGGTVLDDIVLLSNGSLNLYGGGITNNASIKADFEVRRSYSYIGCGASEGESGGIFAKGPFEVNLNSSYTTILSIDVGETGESFNSTDATVDVVGKGTLYARMKGSTPFAFRAGATLDFDGALVLYKYADKAASYLFSTDVTGGNLKDIRTESAADDGYAFDVKVDDGVTLTAPRSIAITNGYSRLTGGAGAKVLIGAENADYTFKAGINADDALTIWKTGACEVVVSATTNMPNLVLDGGVVRFTDDCVIGNMTVTGGAASVIADGCVVTLPATVEGYCSFETANGGSFAGATIFRAASFDLSNVRFRSGTTNIFSSAATANTDRWWRWTFTKLYTARVALRLQGLYLFDDEGNWVNEGLTSVSPHYVKNDNYTTLESGKARFFCSSVTNIVELASPTQFKINQLYRLFAVPAKHSNGNSYHPCLTSPQVDETNPDSAVAVEFCLTNSENSTGYNLRSGGASSNRYTTPLSWTVESSADGTAWTLVDDRVDVEWAKPTTAFTTIDGVAATNDGELNATNYMKLTRFPLSPIAGPVSLCVEEGAVVDFRAVVGGQPVSGITIDWDNPGQGVVLGAKPAANGTLNFVNLPSGTLPTAFSLPFSSGADMTVVTEWRVTVNGVERRWKVRSNGDGTYRCDSSGFMIFVR